MLPGIGLQEIVIIGIVAVILFGRKLPDVAKNAGKSYYEFKKGLFDVQKSFDPRNFIDDDSSASSSAGYDEDEDSDDDYDQASAPKFTPPPAQDQPVDSV